MPNKENVLNAFAEFLDSLQADADLDAVDDRIMECLVGCGYDPNSDLVSMSDLDGYVSYDDLGREIEREIDSAIDLDGFVEEDDVADLVRDAVDDLDLVRSDDLREVVRDELTDAIDDEDLVRACDFDDKMSDFLADCDLVHRDDLEEYLDDDLGYGAWVDTTAQFMQEFRQRLVALEMREVLADLAEVCRD